MGSFLGQYLATALWASTDPDTGEPLDRDCSPEDFAPEARAQAQEECERFQREAAELLQAAYATGYYGESTAGLDFFLTRNGHGAGFWDRDLPEGIGDKLTEIAHSFGESLPYPGDDGLIYWM